MKKITIIYWSGTGNTEMMAEAISKGAQAGGVDVKLLNVSDASISDVTESEVIALGCPSMGDEVLEESEMEPFVESIKDSVNGKNIALFGSYGWGNGEWMDDWEERMKSYGANLFVDSLIINETPDEEGLERCEALGRQL